MAQAQAWTPYNSLTKPPTNLKEAIDWVLRVTGRDGKKNEKTAPAAPPSTSNAPHCLCYLAKAIKDLLYDAKDPGSPGPSPERNWDEILLEQEKDIVKPVLTDLGLLSTGSTSAVSTTTTCAGGTEVIKALIDQLALGLQKWVGWKEDDECCLKGENGKESKGIGKKCECSTGGVSGCCSTSSGTTCHQCGTCGTSATGQKCYQSAYCKATSPPSSPTDFLWTSISSDSDKVHLLARIFLGSVCLIWSGLSQLGFLTKEGSGGINNRWSDSSLHEIKDDGTSGLGSFMAAMGYDLERLNQGGKGNTGNGEFVHTLLTGKDPKTGVAWNEFKNGTDKDSVAEYYSSIYSTAQGAAKSTSETLCKQYPLLVLHILASGYFRAGSAGAKGITSPAKPAEKKDTPVSRKPRTIREILYWLSALPYSQGYKALVDRMKEKYPRKENKPEEFEEQIVLHGEGAGKKTELHKDKITHYLMAACGYCPLVLIGIQGTIEREVTQPQTQSPPGQPEPAKKCEKHKKNPSAKRCTLEDANKAASAAPKAAPDDGKLKEGEVCYGGYHLEVSKFGPLHGMYANGLFGFDMDGSPAQCLDQLRVYVYHCFYQLYFLRKQCSVGAIAAGGGGAGKTVLGWNSCRYGSGVAKKSGGVNVKWQCTVENTGSGGTDHTKKCGLQSGASTVSESALQGFLCDSIYGMYCRETLGKTPDSEDKPYPEIDAHMNKTVDSKGIEHPAHLQYPQLCPVPMGWSKEGTSGENHFKDLTQGTHKQAELTTKPPGTNNKYPVHCTGNTLALLLEYYCDPEKCPSGTLVVLLRLLACITPTVPRTLGDLFGFYYYIVYIGGNSASGVGEQEVNKALGIYEQESKLHMLGGGPDAVVEALTTWNGGSSTGCSAGGCTEKSLKCLYGNGNKCTPFLCPLSGQQYGQLSPVMAGTYLSWLVYLIGEFQEGLKSLETAFRDISCKDSECHKGAGGVGGGCDSSCTRGTHGETCSGGTNQGVCGCTSVVSCTGVLPVLYKYGFGYGDVSTLHPSVGTHKKCHDFLTTLGNVEKSTEFTKLTTSINQLIYTTRLPWIFVLTIAWLVAVLYLAVGAIWPLDWAHMRSHCRGWFRKGSLSPWEVLMVGKKKGRGILEYFGKT
ncbi:variant erythrocyte surface antigen-1 beta subunit [Babesia bovis T2Bo]|uniref:variant erythrocyte surface antigen-1 beta subunit n=1 Tax=Babesia bovis T2Bo TaxID=484906 RepID=UPI001C35DFC1|nr:variant erythrocyte surface antigen-1 beta subunit [Babesia bovis T2Bo]KAG6440224.1 variant erythrocyte surface antigen-1 beta subunit [Babesia bovis T2Bo]